MVRSKYTIFRSIPLCMRTVIDHIGAKFNDVSRHLFSSSCTGVLRYSSVTTIPTDLSTLPAPSLATIDELLSFAYSNPYEPLLDIDQMPRRQADKEIYLHNFQARTSDGSGMRWYINNATLDHPRLSNLTRPLLFDVYNGIEENIPRDATYSIDRNQLIDVVLQNTVATNGVCESHPFHIHGHKFWIHSHGIGSYNSTVASTPVNSNPILRDSLTLYATSYSHLTPNRTSANYLQPCGWVKIRFLADNPGLWLLHCHIGSHLLMGMNALFKEDVEHLNMNYISRN